VLRVSKALAGPRKADFEDTGISEIPVSLLSDDVLRRRRRQEEEEEVSWRIL
jgi:hypothetical protein